MLFLSKMREGQHLDLLTKQQLSWYHMERKHLKRVVIVNKRCC